MSIISESDFEEIKVIKELQFTRLSLGKLRTNGEQVIIKRFKTRLNSKQEKLRFTREVQILRTFNSPYKR